MRTLIIGGTGLISTSLTRQLLARGEEVTLYNRGRAEARFPEGAKRLTGDRKEYAAFEAQMAGAGSWDCVIDMINYLPEDAESAARAFRGRTQQFIFCSTVDVYQKPATRYPYREDEPRAGLGDYARNKVSCEAIMMEAHRKGDLPVTILRPAHTYGEGGVIIHSLGGSTTYLDRIRKGKPIVVHGDGNSLWVSCHIDDVARAFVNAIGNAKTLGKAYHVPGEEWMTWNVYHQKVAEAMGAPPPTLVHIPSELLARVAPKRAGVCAINFQFNNIFDTTAARTDLDFRYTIPFVEGARRTIAFLEERGRIASSDDDPFDDRIIAAWQRLGAAMGEDLRNLM
jgi:nucleoside-diphosphate-sugar epimerase